MGLAFMQLRFFHICNLLLAFLPILLSLLRTTYLRKHSPTEGQNFSIHIELYCLHPILGHLLRALVAIEQSLNLTKSAARNHYHIL